MDENLKVFIKELSECEGTYAIKRWQLRVFAYLDETFGNEKANRFESLNINDNPWDGSARQLGYLEALLAKKKSSDEDTQVKQMLNVKIPKAICSVVGEILSKKNSHETLNRLFKSSGVPGEPPALAHHSKWKDWLFKAGTDPNIDSFEVLGNVLEEFMDVAPNVFSVEYSDWESDRKRIVSVLEKYGFRYFQGGRVFSHGLHPQENLISVASQKVTTVKPESVEELLTILVRGLPRAMHPLIHRRKGAQTMSFSSEYDVQDLLHSMLRPWVLDIRPEEFTPSYAGSNARMDFLLPAHKLVIELKFVRDRSHGKKLGDELIIDFEHYRRHPECEILWCVIYDPGNFIPNPEGLRNDLEGDRTMPDGKVQVKIFVLSM
jgi:hypothetical protein